MAASIRTNRLLDISPPDLHRDTRVWGFADLHAHPASHLGFGATVERDGGGVFWGRPGLALEASLGTLDTDLQPCDANKHAGFDEDPIRHELRTTVVSKLADVTELPHGAGGWPTFDAWPHSQSVFHQQMHVSWIHRAWQGGLRLMLACVTDNQVMSRLWLRHVGDGPLSPDASFDFESAKRQLAFIRRLAEANATWMEIVTTPAQARRTIRLGKLALVLSVEMDSLSVEQVVELQDLGVRHIIPVHLVDNRFGGVAVYSDLFNSTNLFMNGSFLRVVGDPSIKFRLGRPSGLWTGPGGLAAIVELPRKEYCELGYECCPEAPAPNCIPAGQGHKNQRGLSAPLLQTLMARGLMIDLAHMSEASQSGAIELAQRYGCPLMNSHTGLRGDDGFSERGMRRSDAVALGALGGVLGLGTEGNPDYRTLFYSMQREGMVPYAARFTGSRRGWMIDLPRLPDSSTTVVRLHATIRTGEDNLRGNNDNVHFFVLLRGAGEPRYWRDINQRREWHSGTTALVVFELPAGTSLADIALLGLLTTFGGGTYGDNWDVANVTVEAERPDGNKFLLASEKGLRFDGDWQRWIVDPWPDGRGDVAGDDVLVNLRLNLAVGDDLREGSQAHAFVHLTSGAIEHHSLSHGLNWKTDKAFKVTLSLPVGTRRNDLLAVEIRYDSGPGASVDNWTLKSFRIEAVTPLGDPVARWVSEYLDAFDAMGRRGVAFGTDMNGYAPQVPFSSRPVDYPIDIARRFFPSPYAFGTEPPLLDRLSNGDKVYDFTSDGMAHYGLLPDFVQAIGQDRRMSHDALGAIFRTADDMLKMWELVEAAKRRACMALIEPPKSPLRNLCTWWSESRKDNLTSAASEWAGVPGDAVTAHGGYVCSRIEGAIFNAALPKPAHTVRLNLWWSPSRQDNLLTTNPAWSNRKGLRPSPDYIHAGLQGFIYSPDEPQPPGTVALYRWFSRARGDNFTVSDPSWAGKAGDRRDGDDGYEFVRMEGYALAPLTRLCSWWSEARRDNFATTAAAWSGLPGYTKDGYAYFRTEGRLFAPDGPQPAGTIALWSWWSPSREDNFLAVGNGGGAAAPFSWPPDYEFVGLQGYAFPADRPQPKGTLPLYHWWSLDREDNFVTTDQDWAGKPGDINVHGYTFVTVLGFIAAP